MELLKRLSETIFDSTIGLAQAWQKRSIQMVKIEAAKYYLRTIQMIRRQSILLVSGLFCVFLVAVALVVMPVALVLFSPLSLSVKFNVVCVLAALDLAIPILFLCSFFSQKNWMRFTKSDELLANAVRED
jgi:hypothetical protein